jgi:hypothetical protein
MGAYLSVALGIQNAPWMPHAVEFSSLYAYKITAKEEKVEVWEDFVGDHLEKGGFGSSRPFRSTQRYMRKGESIMISAATPQFISEDFSLDGKPIKRVRISRGDGLLSLLINYRRKGGLRKHRSCKHHLHTLFPIQGIPSRTISGPGRNKDPLAFRL